MKKKWLWLIPPALLIICLGVLTHFYLQGFHKSEEVFNPGTYINGVEVAGLTPDEAEAKLNPTEKTFTVTELDAETGEYLTEVIDLVKLGYQEYYDTETVLENQLHQTYFLSYRKGYENRVEIEDIGYKMDETKVDGAIAALYCMQEENQEEPVNAEIKAENGYFSVTESSDGCLIDVDKATAALKAAIMDRESALDLTQGDYYLTATVKTDDPDLQAQVEDLEAVYKKTITIPMYGEVKEVIEEQTLRKLVVADGFTFSIDEDALDEYMQELWEKYTTWKTERTFTTSKGETIKVGTEADIFGYDLAKAMTRESIHELLLQKSSGTATAYWDSEGAWDDETGNDIGKTYIEISIDDQHLWYYEDGKLVLETDVVTGKKGVTDTPKGVFKVWAKRNKVTLVGEDYKTPVDMWMPIDWDGVGIHDASWRSTFGGTIYETSGSHGCINTPTDKVKILFEKVALETPVVIY